MSHDFIIAEGRLSGKKIRQAMENCVAYKHQKMARETGQAPYLLNVNNADLDIQKTVIKKANVAYYHGYADGVFYRLFSAQKYNNGISGVGDGLHVSKYMAERTLIACAHLILSSPHSLPIQQKQARELMSFAENVIKPSRSQYFTAIFC